MSVSGNVRIVNADTARPVERLLKILSVSLAALLGVIILFSYENPSISGYSVLQGVYGSASPFIILFLLLIIIYLYFRIHRD